MIPPTKMKACFIAAVTLTLILPQTAWGQVRAADLNRALARLQFAVDALPPFLKPPRLVAAVNWLDRRAATTNPADVSEGYVQSLQRAADLLREGPRTDVVDDVTRELEVKVEHCRLLGIGMGGSVQLYVNTRRGRQTVSDWQVFYLLKIYERVSAASPVTFPTLSTPTEARLDPGRYWLWARDPATGRTSERALVSVAGQTQLRVDLPVP
jgi:hypothetical protein